MNLNQRINDAAQYIKARITEAPSIGLILGSGLGVYLSKSMAIFCH